MKPPFELQEGEEIVRIVRRHWLHFYPRILALLLVWLAPIIALWAVVLTRFELSSQVRIGLIIISALWFLFWGIRLYFTAYRYNNDMWTITDQRLIDSVRVNPFSLRMESADLINVQDISINRTGIIRTLFNYGDVECETAAETGKFTLEAVPRPGDVQLLIDRLRDAQRAKTVP